MPAARPGNAGIASPTEPGLGCDPDVEADNGGDDSEGMPLDALAERLLFRLHVETQGMLQAYHDRMQRSVEDWAARHEQSVEQVLANQRQYIDNALQAMSGRTSARRIPKWPSQREREGAAVRTLVVAPAAEPSTAEPLTAEPLQAEASGTGEGGPVLSRLPSRRTEASKADSVETDGTGSTVDIHGPSIRVQQSRRFGSRFMMEGSIFDVSKHRQSLGSGLELVSEQGDDEEMNQSGQESLTRVSRCRRFVRRCVKSSLFDVFCGAVIIANTIVIGLETDYLTKHPHTSDELYATQLVMNGWYVAEVVLRMVADGWRFFYDSKEWQANVFDTVLVAYSLADVLIDLLDLGDYGINNSSSIVLGRILRMIRLFRILRTVRIFHLLRHLSEFRRMVFLLVGSVQTLFWSLLLIFAILYTFAVWFCQGVTQALQEEPDSPVAEDLKSFYGSLPKTILSLYMAISEGTHWHYLMDPLKETDWVLSALFLVFISVTHFAVLNIVAAVFVEGAVQSTQRYRDLMVQEKQHQRETNMKHLKHIFGQIDRDGSGEISVQELDHFLKDEQLELKSYFDALDINASEAQVLFKLLDVDGSGKIDIDEFVKGCFRLKGTASSFDINCMMYENRRVNLKFQEFMKFVEDRFEFLEGSVQELEVQAWKILDSGRAVEGVFAGTQSFALTQEDESASDGGLQVLIRGPRASPKIAPAKRDASPEGPFT